MAKDCQRNISNLYKRGLDALQYSTSRQLPFRQSDCPCPSIPSVSLPIIKQTPGTCNLGFQQLHLILQVALCDNDCDAIYRLTSNLVGRGCNTMKRMGGRLNCMLLFCGGIFLFITLCRFSSYFSRFWLDHFAMPAMSALRKCALRIPFPVFEIAATVCIV